MRVMLILLSSKVKTVQVDAAAVGKHAFVGVLKVEVISEAL